MIDNKTIRKVIMLNKMLPGGSPTYEDREASGAIANFTTNVVMPFVSLDCQILPKQEGSGTPSPSNPRPISGTSVLDIYHSGADTSDYDTTSVALGQEIIGGTADVVGGVGSITHIKKRLLHTDNWETAQNAFYLDNFFTDMPSAFVTSKQNPKCKCNVYIENDVVNYSGNVNDRDDYSFFNQLSPYQERLWVKDSTFSTLSDFLTYLENNEVYICIPLSTPTEFTFTGQPIKSLLGTNNVWTDSGDTKVTYKYKTGEGGSSTKKYLPIFYDLYGKGCRHL